MNGTPYGFFKPTRGLRQGDPLSPLLFVLCTEGFAALLRRAVNEGKLEGIKVAPRAPRISHLFFADDSYLFLRGSLSQCENLIDVLNEYEELSGQRVNLEKSAVCFSKNVAIPDQEFLAQILGVGAVGVQDKYLGLPTLIAQSKMATFRYVEERLLARLQGWARRTLSLAAKEILLKSVASALPLHVMSCFKLPLSLCRALDRLVARFWWGVEDGRTRLRWMSWRKMCRSKHDGGMGFRRFKHFNQALLAKIGWRILEDPSSLLARVYKGKYFPTGSFLSATARSRPSWGWQSVLYGRQLLLRGLRWQVGNGRSVSALEDSWVPALHPQPPLANPLVLPREGILKVADLLCPGEGRWSEEKLCQWFSPASIKAIKAIPLSRQDIGDKLIWHETGDGVFSVKSAYHLAVAVDAQQGHWGPTVSLMDRPSWIRLWGLPIPPKLKIFLWQVMHRFLPTTEALRERDVMVHPRCPVCWGASETMEHLFLECPVARNLWELAGMGHLGEGLPRHSFPLFLKKLLMLLRGPEEVMALVALLWRIWKSRNWVVFEGKQFDFPALVRQFCQQVEEWRSLPAPRVDGAPRLDGVALVPPNPDTLVCRWDGATRRGSHSAGGMVLLDQGGVPRMASAVRFPGMDDPMVVELLTLREAMIWCTQEGLEQVRFEGDAQVVINRLAEYPVQDSRAGAIFQEVQRYMGEREGFSVRFVGRRSNRVAHLVARKALSLYPTMSRSFDFVAWLRHSL
ncbi:unnamed protein product [Linum trigynum]|uniref:Reverse transcriptase domain-containing protein n=1 Tax=Linum trigynum TaxID=586398 RepID=A0AAV2DN27_9ROSI